MRNKRNKKGAKRTDDEDDAIRSYRSTTLHETWADLAHKIREKEAENEKNFSKNVPRRRVKLADYLFKDWEFYTFPRRDSKVVVELFR